MTDGELGLFMLYIVIGTLYLSLCFIGLLQEIIKKRRYERENA